MRKGLCRYLTVQVIGFCVVVCVDAYVLLHQRKRARDKTEILR